ncbi:MAG TPA: 5-methyltetrahydropteroyltriglutamate--homocysteine S-methyltransferase [Xanthobacteraceae bacterium]|jgi:5-methyltetrahydropteroyltriglutamate--homocysteine methyltransferase|nr:5-methyltetrahydropteroyltriglutamate--homocysteine S-methyltransferase [Xanthobacteraceae bacterium]
MGRPPFRADHVGSLLRPAELRQAFKRFHAGELDGDTFHRIQDESIRAVVGLQETTGLQVVTDGEFRRASYWGRFVERTAGFEFRQAAYKFRDELGHEMAFTTPYAAGKLSRVRALAVDEFEFLCGAAKATPKITPKITLPAPSTMHFYAGRHFADPKIYADATAFFADLALIYQQELGALVKAGCRYVQLDEVALAMLCDEKLRAQAKSGGQDPDALVDTYIDAINRAVANCPPDVAVGVHVCRGNFKGHYLSEGGYESVAERFFAGVNATHFLLEYDTKRAGDFAPLRFVPKNKGVVVGLISSKTPVLETADDLRRGLDEAARYIDLDRLAIGPQCGFASTVAGNPVTEADQWKKLARAVEVAAMVWGSP